MKLWASNLSGLKNSIAQVNDLIGFLDIHEDFRELSNLEQNLRDISKQHMLDLLERQNTYWRQRGKINLVKLGDARATVSWRHNHITSLKNDSQIEIVDHDRKAAILWNASKIEWAGLNILKCILTWEAFMEHKKIGTGLMSWKCPNSWMLKLKR